MDGLLNAGHSLYMDNFYNSPVLAIRLLLNDTYVTGTLRQRKGLPAGFVHKTKKHKEMVAKRGERPLCFTTWNNQVMIGKWKEKDRAVSFISTEHDCELVNIPRKPKFHTQLHSVDQNERTRRQQRFSDDIFRPEAVAQYNKFMSGIDLADQMLAYYSPLRKTLAWYKKLFFHLTSIMLYNAFKLYRIALPHKQIYFEDFIEFVARQYTGTAEAPHHCLVQRIPRDNASTVLRCHTPSLIPPSANVRSAQRDCVYCKVVAPGWNRVRTRYECALCPSRPALCVNKHCFAEYHNLRSVAEDPQLDWTLGSRSQASFDDSVVDASTYGPMNSSSVAGDDNSNPYDFIG
jgi:hypothetical protein